MSTDSLSALVHAGPINYPGPIPSKQDIEKKQYAAEIGPCLFAFFENCLTGPYLFNSFILSTGNLRGDSSSNNTYRHDYDGLSYPYFYDTTSTHSFDSTSDISLEGIELGIGYDFGGVRNELSYSTNSGVISNLNITGSDITKVRIPAQNCYYDHSRLDAQAYLSSMDVQKKNLLYSIALDIPTGTKFIPYIGSGIGISLLSLESVSVKTTDGCGYGSGDCDATFESGSGVGSTLIYQLKAGLAYQINVRSTLFIEALNDYTNSVKVGNITLNGFTQSSGKLGLRYRF